MKVSLDIRDIINYDPMQHSGVYDHGEQGSYSSIITEKLEPEVKYESGKNRRCHIHYNHLSSINDLQKYLALPFIAASNSNKNSFSIKDSAKIPGALYRQKHTKNSSLLMSSTTWNRIAIQVFENRTFWSYKANYLKFLKWLYERSYVVLNDYIPIGQIIGVGLPEFVGVTTCNGLWLNPIGIGVWPDTITTCFLEGNYADL